MSCESWNAKQDCVICPMNYQSIKNPPVSISNSEQSIYLTSSAEFFLLCTQLRNTYEDLKEHDSVID